MLEDYGKTNGIALLAALGIALTSAIPAPAEPNVLPGPVSSAAAPEPLPQPGPSNGAVTGDLHTAGGIATSGWRKRQLELFSAALRQSDLHDLDQLSGRLRGLLLWGGAWGVVAGAVRLSVHVAAELDHPAATMGDPVDGAGSCGEN